MMDVEFLAVAIFVFLLSHPATVALKRLPLPDAAPGCIVPPRPIGEFSSFPPWVLFPAVLADKGCVSALNAAVFCV